MDVIISIPSLRSYFLWDHIINEFFIEDQSLYTHNSKHILRKSRFKRSINKKDGMS